MAWRYDDITDLSTDSTFRTKYTGFYILNHMYKSPQAVLEYFKIMQRHCKIEKTDITNTGSAETLCEGILNDLYNAGGRVELSYTSKLLHTINPDLPILDSRLADKNKLGKISTQSIPLALESYTKFNYCYEVILRNRELTLRFVNAFDNIISDEIDTEHRITTTKKIDFLLWGIRPNKKAQ